MRLDKIMTFVSRCRVTTQVSVNSQIRVHVIKNVSFSLLQVTFSIKANFEKILVEFPGSLKPSSSICYVFFSVYFKLRVLSVYFLQALTPALTFTLKLLGLTIRLLALVFYER